MAMMIQGQMDQQQEGGNIICSDGPRDCFQFISSSSSSLLAAVLRVCPCAKKVGTIVAGHLDQIPRAYHCQEGGTQLSIFYVQHPLCSGYHHSIQRGLVNCFVVVHGHVVAPRNTTAPVCGGSCFRCLRLKTRAACKADLAGKSGIADND